MKNYYWYLIVDKDSKFVSVDKIKGFIFNDYKFINEVSPKIKKIIKRMLKECPTNHRYIFNYVEKDCDFSIVKCVGVMCIDYCHETNYWRSLCGENFFHFCQSVGLCVPDHHLGSFVFNNLEDNVKNGILTSYDRVFKVNDTDVYVYPLKAFE